MIELTVKTPRRRALVEITDQVRRAVRQSGIAEGVCTLYVPHTTAGITVNESADPAVREDIVAALSRLVPEDLAYRHLEGNAHAHVQAALVGHSVQLMVAEGALQLGTWQGIFFCEFDGPRSRRVWLTCTPALTLPS